jgi:Domain of unknown function (DUF4145)
LPQEQPVTQNTFVVDCFYCKSKKAVIEQGTVERRGMDSEDGEWGQRIKIGQCSTCGDILVAEAKLIAVEDEFGQRYTWSDEIRVHPCPGKEFASDRIPNTLRQSLVQAERSMQANANIAACAMLGRALEALCRDQLKAKDIMLGAGIKQLKDQNIIDERLFDWSQQLHAYRNLAAHSDEEFDPTRRDTEDMQAFVYAITEYVYDLTDRYNEFKERMNFHELLKNRHKKTSTDTLTAVCPNNAEERETD